MLCQLCEVEEASVTIIPTGEGMPQSVCSPCMARMGVELAKVQLPAEEIAAMLGPMFVTPAREDLHQEAEKVRKGRKSETPKQRRERRQALGQLLAEAGETEAAKEIEAEGEAGGETETPAPAANE